MKPKKYIFQVNDQRGVFRVSTVSTTAKQAQIVAANAYGCAYQDMKLIKGSTIVD